MVGCVLGATCLARERCDEAPWRHPPFAVHVAPGGARLDAFLLSPLRDAVRASFFALAAVAASLLALVPRAARADNQWRLQTSFDARDEWIRSMPSLSLHSPFDTPIRTLPGGASLPSTGSQQFATLTWDAGATVNDRWMVPIFGLQFGWAAGTSSEVVSSIDGSP